MPEIRDSSQPDLSLAIPCFNEEELLANTVGRLWDVFESRGVRLEMVLVDNGSTDGTGAVIDRLIEQGLPVTKKTIAVNAGYGNGILVGLAACRGRWVGILHADGQVEPEDVLRVYEVANGSRRPCLVKVRRRFRMDGLRRKVVSIIYNLVINVLYPRLGSIDVNGNPKLMPRECLAAMNLVSKDWFLDAEILIKARELKLPVIEFNVLSQMRSGGKSNVNVSTCREFVINLLRWRLGGLASRRKSEQARTRFSRRGEVGGSSFMRQP